jgi:Leucine-rich repeat (LRR) protein
MAGMTKMRRLILNYCPKITDDGIKALTGMTSMRTLNLSHSNITDEGLACIAGMTSLEVLNLSSCHKITSAGIASILGKLTSLEVLKLGYYNNNSDALIRSLPLTLKHLEIEVLTDASVLDLCRRLKHLRYLELYRWTVTDKCTEAMVRMPALKEVNFSRCQSMRLSDLISFRRKPELILSGIDAGMLECLREVPEHPVTAHK